MQRGNGLLNGSLNGLLGAALAITFAGLEQSALAQSEIKIGEINSYSLLPAFTEPYRKG
jgi:branched-chain amino acid transport system substrate-binding protein